MFDLADSLTKVTKMTDVVASMQTNDAPVPVKDGAGDAEVNGVKAEEMTSKDYYFDSYAHFGIHEASKIIFNTCTQSWFLVKGNSPSYIYFLFFMLVVMSNSSEFYQIKLNR